jgi:EAL domain-containing protein (putative c-di-GMP-specific phosphodiesterase class I)
MRIPVPKQSAPEASPRGPVRAILLATAYLTGIRHERKWPEPRPRDSVMATVDVLVSAVGIATVLAVAIVREWGDRRSLTIILALVLVEIATSLLGAWTRRPAVNALALLSAILGWPVLLVVLATNPLDAVGIHEGGLVIGVAGLVGLALSTVLRPRVLAAGLAAATMSLMAASVVAGSLEPDAWIAAIGMTVASVVGAGRRIALDRLLRDRDYLGLLMHHVAPGPSIEETALRAAWQLREAGSFDVVLISALAPAGAIRHLAHASILRVPLPLEVGAPIPDERAAYLRSRLAAGPWVTDWEASDDTSSYDSRMYIAGIRIMLYVPIVRGGAVVAALGVGYGAATGGSQRRRRALLYERMPGAEEAAALIGALMAPQLSELGDREAEIAAIRDVIDGDRFHSVFQPIVELGTGRVVGYEALTRFDSGQPPDVVFERANRVGLGTALEKVTLAAGLAAARSLELSSAWLSVNLSPEFIHTEDVSAALREAPRPLVLEVTEHVAIEDYAALTEAVRALGPSIRLAVDDAGAGIANLRHVLELCPDVVKLDIVLVRGIGDDEARQALVAGMVHFAARGRFFLIAEGIETEEERDTLISLGVRLGQGYLIGRPDVGESFARSADRAA